MPCDTRSYVMVGIGSALTIVAVILFITATNKMNSIGDEPWILRDEPFFPSGDPDVFDLTEECTNYPSSRVNGGMSPAYEGTYGTDDCTEKFVAFYTTYTSQTDFYGVETCTTEQDIYGEDYQSCSSDGGKCFDYMVACFGVDVGSAVHEQCSSNGLGPELGENPPITFQGQEYYNFADMEVAYDFDTQGFQADDISGGEYTFSFTALKACAASVDDGLDGRPLLAQMNYNNGGNAFGEGVSSFFDSLGDYMWSVVLAIAGSIFFCIACCCACGACGGESTVVVVQQ